MRLDQFVSETYTQHSRSTWQKLIKNGHVHVDDIVIRSPKYNVNSAQKVAVALPDVPDFSSQMLQVIYEDENVIVIDKPVGILTHSKGVLNNEFTVADFFKRVTQYHLDTNRSGIIHRLDRATSGVLIGAKNELAAKKLMKQFQDRTVKKIYMALVAPPPSGETALIDLPIARNPNKPSTFRVDPNGKSAQTVYSTLKTNGQEALLELRPKTGRTHQLRVHLAHIHAPIIGDTIYGAASDRLFLHAHKLEITIPGSKRMTFESPLPGEFNERMTSWIN